MAGDWGCASDYHPNDCSCRSCQKSREFYEKYPNCFPFCTLIETPSGKVPIGKLSKGQMILSYNQGVLVPRMITRYMVRGLAMILEVEFDSGNVLRTTNHHSFLTQNGWEKLANIRPGDEIIRVDGVRSLVKSITKQNIEQVFNIYTAGEHNFIADGFVAHNFTEFRTIRTILHQMFLDPVAKLEIALG